MAIVRSTGPIVALLAATIGLIFLTRDSASRVARSLHLPDAYDADSWFRLRRVYPTGHEPGWQVLDRVARAVRPLDGVRPALVLPGERWVPIGPSPIAVPGALPWVGRITAVAPHPSLAGTIYAGADNGGIWRTVDGGATWTPLTDGIPVPSIQSIAIDPINPQIIYASTIPRTYAVRWLRSADGGQTWDVSAVSLGDGRTLTSALCSINQFKACIPPSSGRVFIDPRRAGSAQTSTVYFVGASHLLRSDDSGRTFRPVLALGVDLDFAGPDAPNEHREAEYLRDVAMDRRDPDRLYAVVATPRCADGACARMTSGIGVYRTTDGGASWTRQDVGALAEYSLENTRYADPGAVYVPRARIAVAPSNGDVVALAFRDEVLGRPRVYRSVDAGDAWAETSPPATSLTWPLALAISPVDPATMYVGSSSIYRTIDGGQSWTTMQSTHVDNIELGFTAAGALVAGNDGGIFLNTGGTAFIALHQALPVTEFYSVAAHPSNGLLLAGGTQDNGTLVFQGSVGWSLLTGGDGGDTVFDPRPGTTTLYAEIEWYFVGPNNVFQFFRCEPNGCVTRMNGIDRSVGGPFIPDMAMDPSSPTTLWLTAAHLFRTDDRGDLWTTASPSVAAHERCWNDTAGVRRCAAARYFTAAAVAPAASHVVYAGTLNGDVWLTEDRGATWRSIAGPVAGPLPVRPVTDVVVDPLDARTLYVAYSGFDEAGSGRGHVFRSRDAGTSWEDLTGDLPDLPVNTLLVDPDSATGSSPRVLYAGTDVGVYLVMLDAGASWQRFGTGMPPVIVNRLAYNATTRQLLAGTYGRGVYAISGRFVR